MSRSLPDTIESIFSFLPAQKSLAAAIIDFLKRFGFLRHELIETREGRWTQIRVYSTNSSRVRSLKLAFYKERIAKVYFTERRLAYKEWADKWKEDYQIQKLGQSFVVIPTWRKKEFNPKKFGKRILIFIDPLSAFGSGEHETTRLVVRLMEQLRSRFESFLDIGTGTGILSIAAAHCGAQKITGFDNDKPSVECAEFNFSKNGLIAPHRNFIFGELARLKKKPLFDLVCANINSHILENYRKQIVGAAKKGGWVLVSGILNQTYASFREAFDGKDLQCLKILRGRRWVAVLYRKILSAKP